MFCCEYCRDSVSRLRNLHQLRPHQIYCYSLTIGLFNEDATSPFDEMSVLEKQPHSSEESIDHPHENITRVNTTSMLEEHPQTKESNMPNPKTAETLINIH